jgi:hypothetical protein
MQVYDRDGRLIEVADGPVPDGCSVKASVLWMDSEQRAVSEGTRRPRDDGEGLNDAARKAYTDRSKRMAHAWKKKPYHAGPWGDQRPEWQRNAGHRPPAVGPTGRSPYRSQHQDRAADAWEAMVRDVSTRWKTHRRPAAPRPEAER